MAPKKARALAAVAVLAQPQQELAIPETLFIKVADGEPRRLAYEMAKMSPYIELISRTGAGREPSAPILLPQQVNDEVMDLVEQYMAYHSVAGRSDKEKRQFNEKFVRIDTKRLCELTSGADALKLRPVVDLASRQLARMIEGKSPDEIRAAFNLPDDLTEEEKLEPIRNVGEDARIRLLNRLYAKKRQARGRGGTGGGGAAAPGHGREGGGLPWCP
ncbi:MAG: Skp1 family, dimerization domain-containing protein [Monoraphidium minutum]|nr:MAG: Skp1 family, dimerization domain-containing protein [Monoraphidium minutum]